MRIFKAILAVFTALNISAANESKDINFDSLEHARVQNAPLSQRQLAMIPIAIFTATGKIDELKEALVKGLEAGLSINEIKEALSHQSVYIGFPRGLNGIATFNKLLKEREAAGIKDARGKEASPIDKDADYYDLGVRTLTYLSKNKPQDVLYDAQAADYGLKAYLFGYLFSRDILSFVDREIIVVSTLASLEGVDNQLRSHLNLSKNLGLKDSELKRIFEIIERNLGKERAKNAALVLENLTGKKDEKFKSRIDIACVNLFKRIR